MNEWAEYMQYLINNDYPRNTVRSLIIEGEDWLGQTEWARAIGKHNYIAGEFDVNPMVYSNKADYNVIDNIPPKELKNWKELLGLKEDWQSYSRDGKALKVKGGIPAIILCNPAKGSSYKEFLNQPENVELKIWTERNAIFVNINERLWKKE